MKKTLQTRIDHAEGKYRGSPCEQDNDMVLRK